jgi:uncharacterized protein (DUF433 family)
MNKDNLLTRITVNPETLGGKPIIRGRRLAAGDSPQDILEAYEWLEPEDIRTCLLHASRLIQ